MIKDMEQQSPGLGPRDQKDFEKFLKFLSLKAVQIIVQSRNGEKVHTSSKPPAVGQHWFNLAVDDMPEITSETKKSMGGCLPSKERPMCIEISLKTSEGESMVLETWCLGMNNRQDSHAKITFTVYNRMGMLLKSLVAVTRVTPAYRLARKQGIDYDICYRVYFGDVRISELGQGFQTMHVGSVGTPVGSVTLSAAYRTNLSMTERNSAMPVKSDHYSSQYIQCHEASWETPIRCAPGTQGQLHVGAGVRHVAEEIANATETEVTSSGRTKGISNLSNRRSPTQWTHSTQRATNTTKTFSTVTGHHTKGAFASSPVSGDIPSLPALSSTPPFASLLSNRNSLGSRPGTPETTARVAHRNSMNSSNRKDSSSESVESRQPPSTVTPSLWGGDDDFVLVELKPAFATPSSADGDLGSFYRECQTAPPLTLFEENKEQTLASIMNELDQQLSTYNECMPMFDELVANLQTSQSS